MDDPSGSSLAILTTLALFLGIFCQIAKSVYTSFSYTKLDELWETEKTRKKLQTYIKKGSELLIATSIFGTISQIVFVVCMIFLFCNNGQVKTIYIVYSLPLSFIPLLFIDILSLYIAHRYAEKIAISILPIMACLYWVGILFVWPLSRLIAFLDTIFVKKTQASSAVFEKAILDVVSKGEEEGIFQGSEKNMIEAIMDLREVQTKDIMTPRTDMVCVSITESVSKTLEIANEAGYSRIPVFKESKDDIVGIFYIKDLLNYWETTDRESVLLEKLMRKPYFIPETKPINTLLKEFQEQKLHIAIVLDEYGGTAGIITVEDILEEIVGDIVDEHDRETFEEIRYIDDTQIELDARLHIDDLNSKFPIDVPDEDRYDTVGGFLFSRMGRVPVAGETYQYKHYEFTIIKANERRIEIVLMKILPKENEPE